MTEETLSSTHPPTPPTTEEDRYSWLRLLRSRRVGAATFYRLLAEYGSAQNALIALPEVARKAGVEGYEICPDYIVENELKAARAAKARLLCAGSPDYPDMLNDLANAPPMLWAVGDVDLIARPALSLVGARNASSLGIRGARKLARDLGAEGYAVVSGLARGIDAAAHDGALVTGTIAVVAGGVDVIYPKENRSLHNAIAAHGLLLSEQPMGLRPLARHFPRRNRIIAGLGQALVVVEAATKSGSLITARDALDLGREVLAIPGHPIDARSSGCNALIRDGATLIRHATDVIEALPPRALPDIADQPLRPGARQPDAAEAYADVSVLSPPPRRRPTQELHQEILSRLDPAPLAHDQLLRDLDLPPADVGAALTDLEMSGQILREPGGLLRRTG